ncbi:hypothetical protein LCGC14_0861590 [marine sediment metagenome]|uniref:Uncharacterized protein n=1 Tax=marine sediment metagenome TaxID=412755 RepID=A0A0F9P765_9ZZZZ
MAIDEIRNDLLRELLANYLIANALLASMSDENFTVEDVD